jgi:hypothetical protein
MGFVCTCLSQKGNQKRQAIRASVSIPTTLSHICIEGHVSKYLVLEAMLLHHPENPLS